MGKLWKTLNSPIVLILLVAVLWPFVSGYEHRLAVRFTYTSIIDQLNRTSTDLNKQAKESGIKNAVSSIVSQFVDGFTSGFNSASSAEDAKNAKFIAAQARMQLVDVSVVPGDSSSREKIIGVVHNACGVPISSIHLNVMMYGSDGHLIDTADDSLSDVKMLQPGQDVGFSIDHDLGDSNADAATLKAHHADHVKVQLESFDLEDAPAATSQPASRP